MYLYFFQNICGENVEIYKHHSPNTADIYFFEVFNNLHPNSSPQNLLLGRINRILELDCFKNSNVLALL